VALSDSDPNELGPLSGYAPELANLFVSLAGDIALVVGQDGVIQNVAVGAALAAQSPGNWIGRPWAETVTGDTRRKIELLLQEAGGTGVTRKREVNHPGTSGADIPIAYTALRLGRQGPLLVLGRDLRVVAAIQQQLLGAQQDMERDYWALRRDQSHQRELTQVANDAVMVVSGAALQIQIANPAAMELFVDTIGTLAGPARQLLEKAMQTGKPVEIRTRRLRSSDLQSQLFDIFAAPVPGHAVGNGQRLLLRARQVGSNEGPPANIATVITDTAGRILMANDALVAMCSEGVGNTLYGRSLCSLLDSGQGALATVLERVKREGMAKADSVVLGGHGMVCEADIWATLINDGDQERIGFNLNLHASNAADTLAGALQDVISHSQGQPLSALLQQVQALTERHAIGDALRSTRANMEASASLLGISTADLSQRLGRLGMDRAHFTAH
jgi:PAS domain-containing protein